MNNDEELKRILDMVENGSISPAEGTRLMDSLRLPVKSPSVTCPYCAETIRAGSRHCPECGSNLEASLASPAGRAGSFHALSGLGRFLVIYTLVISGIKLLSLFAAFSLPGFIGCLLAAIGLTAGILILKGHPAGWNLGIAWAALQFITVIIHGQVLNIQVLHLGFNFNVNGQGFGVNLVGLILLILFIKARPVNQ